MADEKVIAFIPMDLDNVCGLEYDDEEFKLGVKRGSYFAGVITSLVNAHVDMDIDHVMEIIKEMIRSENKQH